MFKLCLLAILATSARAGLIGGVGLGHGLVAAAPVAVAPVAVHGPAIAVSHGATSYQNSNSISLNPVAVATPVVTKVAAPIAVAAPVAVGVAPVGLGYGGLGGYGGYGKGLAIGGLGLGGYH